MDMEMEMMDSRALLRKIQALSFAKHETALFLNCHRDNAAAMAHYYTLKEELDRAVDLYQGKFGPLFADGVQGKHWTWIDGPWPWQRPGDMPPAPKTKNDSKK